MRFLERDKRTVYFAKYQDKVEITKQVKGKTVRTGEYTEGYTEPTEAVVYVSTPTGQTIYTPKGLVDEYTRRVYSETDLGLTTDDVFWLDVSPEEAHDYRIVNVSVSFNHAIYYVKLCE